MAAPENVFTTLRGLFLKQGRIVKNWKERKFELKGMVQDTLAAATMCSSDADYVRVRVRWGVRCAGPVVL